MAEERAATCPQCSADLVVRVRRADGREFVGCSRWPACAWTGPIPAWLELKRSGAAMLPGLEEGQ